MAGLFMGGAYVFPGGKLDLADQEPSVPCDLDAESCAKRLGDSNDSSARGLHVAAVRECLEEAGMFFARGPVAPEVAAAQLVG